MQKRRPLWPLVLTTARGSNRPSAVQHSQAREDRRRSGGGNKHARGSALHLRCIIAPASCFRAESRGFDVPVRRSSGSDSMSWAGCRGQFVLTPEERGFPWPIMLSGRQHGVNPETLTSSGAASFPRSPTTASRRGRRQASSYRCCGLCLHLSSYRESLKCFHLRPFCRDDVVGPAGGGPGRV